MPRRFVVIGLGNFGASVAESLHTARHDVLAVDTREELVDRIAPRVTRAVVADGRSGATLERVGARGADAGVVSTGDDITASILAMLALHDLGVRQVFVKVVSDEHARVMDKLGAAETIFPERDSGHRLAMRVGSAAIVNYFRFGADFSVHEMAVPDPWVGRTLRELALPERHRISVIGRHDMLTDETVAIPDPDAPLTESDTLLVAGKDADLARAARGR
jgi:trk system potassium uptake protein TrkA